MNWIPISQGLPPEGADVLITNGREVAMAQFVHTGKKGVTFVVEPADGEITHWAPRPDLP